MKTHKRTLMACALAASFGIAPGFASAADEDKQAQKAEKQAEKAEKKAEKQEQVEMEVYINRVLKPYTMVKKINSEIYVIDAKSEEDAELKAFNQLKATAKELGADGLIEVKRYVIKDNIASRVTTPSGSMLRDDIDATGEALDELTLDGYNRHKGTLSSKPIDETFDRSKESQRVIRFTGKAIKFD